MNLEKNTNYPSNSLGEFWMKIPLIIRSVLLGLVVSTLGVGTWVGLYNYIPAPWSVLPMAVILILFWMYFSGKWKPLNTQAFRRFCMRQIKLDRPVWIWSIVAAFFLFLFVEVGWALAFRFVEFQPEIFKTASFLNDYPLWVAWPVIIIASMSAGICEEIGFRGYIQAPLEQKYGAIVSITITSLAFVVVHLHQAWASGGGVFLVSFMIGYLAYASRSLIPGIIAHVSFDIGNFSYWWSDILGSYDHKPISMTGVDQHFIISLLVVLLSTILFVVAIWKLLKQRKLTINPS